MSTAIALGLVDYLIISIMLLVSVAIGTWISWKNWIENGNVEMDYALGNRRLPVVPVAVSLATSAMSIVIILGIPAEIYTHGAQIALFMFGGVFGAITAGSVFIGIFYPIKVTSVYEYLELRFHSRVVRIAASVISIILQLMSTIGMFYCACVAVECVSGLPGWAIVLLVAFCSFSSIVMGGMRAVVWTNLYHFVIILTSLVTVFILMLLTTELTFSRMWYQLKLYKREKMWNVDPDPSIASLWSVVPAFGFYWTAQFTGAPCIQQVASVQTRSRAQISMWLAGFIFLILGVIVSLLGMFALALVTSQGCDPIQDDHIASPLEILPLVALHTLNYPGIVGLLVTAIAASTLSGVTSSHLSLACCIWEDVLKTRYYHASENTKSVIIKVSAVLSTCISLGVAIFLALTQKPFPLLEEYVTYTGVLLGPLLGVLILGCAVPYCGPWAALISMSMAAGGTLWIAIQRTYIAAVVRDLPPSLPPLPTYNCTADNTSSLYPSLDATSQATVPDMDDMLPWPHRDIFLSYTCLGACATTLLGALLGLLPGLQMTAVDPHTLFPCVRWLRKKSSSSCCPELEAYEDLPNSLNSSTMFQDTSHIIHKGMVLDFDRSPSLSSAREKLLTIQSETVL